MTANLPPSRLKTCSNPIPASISPVREDAAAGAANEEYGLVLALRARLVRNGPQGDELGVRKVAELASELSGFSDTYDAQLGDELQRADGVYVSESGGHEVSFR